MPTLTCSVRIAAPVSTVFSIFTDLERAPERISAIRKLEVLTPGPFAVGTRFRETRVMFGKEASEVMEVVELQPGKSYSVAAVSCGMSYLTRFDFAADGDGTRVDVTFRAEAQSFFAKLMSPLSGLMMAQGRKMFAKDLDELRKACEGSPGRGLSVAGA